MSPSIVVAFGLNYAIGMNGKIPWHLPDDLNHFKELTTGHVVIMGRKTFSSIQQRLGKPLPNRTSVVISRQTNFKAEGIQVFHSLDAAREEDFGDKKVFIIGGGEIYAQAFPLVNTIYSTQVCADFVADTFFPQISHVEWQEESWEYHKKDSKHDYPFYFITYKRKSPRT